MNINELRPWQRALLLRARDQATRAHLPSFIEGCFGVVNPGTRFLHNWHIELIAEYLEAVREGEITRLIINMPPRALKSVCVSVAWPAWLLGHDPACRILCASYASGLALRHSLDTRLILQHPWYGRVFPDTRLVTGENQKHRLVTTRRGFRFATSVGGTATGEGGDVLIVDDPLHPLQAYSAAGRERTNRWFDQTFSTRLNDKTRGRIVLVMQRLHADDLSGHLLASGGWERLILPALAEERTVLRLHQFRHVREAGEALHPAREPLALIEKARAQLGGQAFSAQYQQRPLAHGGGVFHAAWLHAYDRAPELFRRVTQSWDTAIKAGAEHDASACITVGEGEDGRHYVLDTLTLRAEYPALRRAVLAQAERFAPQAILIEDKASGQSLLQDLRRESALPLIGRMPRQDKLTRAAAVSALVEAGKLVLPRHAPWKAAFEEELLGFPDLAHDDQVDALTQYLAWVREAGTRAPAMRGL
jgi:predicted phage terminase large subunit-like protein